jgi:hypothetical protein
VRWRNVRHHALFPLSVSTGRFLVVTLPQQSLPLARPSHDGVDVPSM